MRLRATVLMLLAAGLLAAPATAAVPYWWWTNVHANRAVVAKNFQLWSHEGASPHSTITKATCKGYGTKKVVRRVRYYRHFICAAYWKYDTPDPNYGSGPFKSPLLCDTTRSKPLGLKCQISA